MGQDDTKPCLGGCGESVPIEEFTENPRCISGYGNICKKCTSRKSRERYRKGRTENRIISQENKDFFQLGETTKDGQIRDLKKVIGIQENTIKALVEVLKEADIRDAKRSRISA